MILGFSLLNLWSLIFFCLPFAFALFLISVWTCLLNNLSYVGLANLIYIEIEHNYLEHLNELRYNFPVDGHFWKFRLFSAKWNPTVCIDCSVTSNPWSVTSLHVTEVFGPYCCTLTISVPQLYRILRALLVTASLIKFWCPLMLPPKMFSAMNAQKLRNYILSHFG